MDKRIIKSMLEEAPVAKSPRTLVCGCGVTVKVSRYQGKEPYKCDNCRHPKDKKWHSKKPG